MKPLLKWAGGKARLADRIHKSFDGPCRGVYYEPFAGSLAVFLHRKAEGDVKKAVLSDVNGKLMAVHRAVRDEVEKVLAALDELPKEDWRERYYEVRTAYNEGPWVGAKHAARFLWLNRACFNGLYRENRSGLYNVPMGSYTQLTLPSAGHFREVAEMLRGVELLDAPFEEILAQARTFDQVYCDPPYVPLSSTACFTGYCKEPFGFAEQKRLAELSRGAASRGAQVILSNHDLPIVRREVYPTELGFVLLSTPMVARAISRKATERHAVGEVIASIQPQSLMAAAARVA